LSFAQHERQELQRKAASARREAVNDMALTIEREAGGAVQQVATRTDSMAREAEVMAGSAERVSTNAGLVADAAGQALTNAQVVAAASEELAASIREVSSQVEHASSVARQAEQKGTEAASTISSLSEAAARIGAVVRLIADIAGRTNLLALNATIEAARAGEAGKGFAVVAGEVKALATQTAKATQEISQQITALQDATGAAVSAIGEIGGTLTEVARISVAVAAAVDQQTAATQEIARNVAQSSGAVQEVTQRIAEVSNEATMVGRQSGKLRSDAGEIAGDITALRGAMVRTVRTASAEADRRLERRIPTSEDCTLLDGQSGARIPGTLCDVSARGAAVSIAAEHAAPSGHVTLVLDRRGGARAGAAVHAASPDGRVHLEFDEQGVEAAFTAAIQTMIGAHDRAAAA
jgi:methyl-accepting chemotaxis protein